VTYKTQSDYPNPDFKDAITDGLYLAYLDVWQRHITTVEDPELREPALNIPDTTTRTKTVWQLKLQLLDKEFISNNIVGETSTHLINRLSGLNLAQEKTKQSDETTAVDLSKPACINFIKDIWSAFLQSNKSRKPYMNACAKLCATSGSSTSSDSRYRRLENQLYRVEIHDPGKVGDDQSGSESKKATFKWSRDNGSIVSIIDNHENFKKGIITIRKSAQDTWATSKTGQWIELLDEERELKGLPGQLARLSRVSGNKIEFDVASLVGDEIKSPTKVRRWDHTTKEPFILTRTGWVELEAGIKVQFDKDSDYKTGDYWLIPARSATNDIEWPNNQAEDPKNRQPLPQAALGIHHDYCLLAAVKVQNQRFTPVDGADYRFIFPALAYAFDKRGDVIEGNLGVGLDKNEKAISRLHARASQFLEVKENVITEINDKQVNVSNASAFHKGDQIQVDNRQEVATITDVDVTAKTLTTEPALTPLASGETTKKFQYRQPIVRLEDEKDETKFIVLANGHTGIGTLAPQAELEVNGKIKTNNLDVTEQFASDRFQGKIFKVTKDPTSKNPITYGLIQVSANPPNRVEFVPDVAKIFAFTNDSKVGICTNDPKNQLDVLGAVAIGRDFAGIQTAPTNGLLVSGQVAIGTPIPDAKAKLHIHGGVVRISSKNGANESYVQIGRGGGEWCDFVTNCPQFYFNQAITIEPSSLKAQGDGENLIALNIPKGKFDDNGHANVKHYGLFTEDGIVKAKIFEGDGSQLTGVVKSEGDNVWGGTLTVRGSTSLATPSNPASSNPTVGIGIENPKSKLTVNGNAAIGASYIQTDAPVNGLLVEGHVGIGDFGLPLKAKLVVGGASNDKQEAALSVTNSDRKDLLLVRNDGNVGIGTAIEEIDDSFKLHVNGSLKVTNAIRCDLLTIGNAPPNNVNDAKLYVDGKLYVSNKLYAKEVSVETITSNNQNVNVLSVGEIISGTFNQISSSALKNEPIELSSQEVREILKGLNPVKFSYIKDKTRSLNAGFIAEDTPDLLTSPDKQTVKVMDVIAVLTKAVKDQQGELEILRERLRALEERDLGNPQILSVDYPDPPGIPTDHCLED
jgi:hypothetical protein